MDMTSTKFEEIMSKHNMHEKDEFKSIKSLNIFYQVYIYQNQHWQDEFQSMHSAYPLLWDGMSRIYLYIIPNIDVG